MDRPNILFITTDQQNCNTLGCYGADVETPNIDALARAGVVLERAYVTCPLCVPSRGSILLGRYPHTTGVMLNDDGREIAEHRHIKGLSDILSENGYDCAYFGKWHLGHDDEPQHGFHAGWEAFLRESYEDWLEREGLFKFPEPLTSHRRALVPYELAHDTHATERTIGFLQNASKGKRPFALWCAMRAPHDPYVGPGTDSYRGEDMPLPSSVSDDLNGKPFCQKENWSQKYKIQVENIRSPGDFKPVIARYQGMVKCIDYNVGRVLRALDEYGLAKNTIVVFHSDHGDMMGAHNMICKGPYMYEETIRVPFIIRFPGRVPENRRMKGLFSLVDIAPTVLEMTGIEHRETFDGVSACKAIEQVAEHFRQAVFAEIFEIIDQRAMILSCRTEHWKYNMHFGDMDELYDLANDPHEMQNLAEWVDMVGVVSKMQAVIGEWLCETGGIDMPQLVFGSKKDRPMNFLSKAVASMQISSI